MLARFLCPHCHASLDPETLDIGCCDRADLRICPACDTPVILDQQDAQALGVPAEEEIGHREPMEEFE